MIRSVVATSFILASLILPNPSRALSLDKAGAGTQATPVSPGDGQGQATIADTCPTFSWGAAPGAQRYELEIYDGQWQDSTAYADQAQSGHLLRQIDIATPALSWTPAEADCLDAGARYLWFVRPHTATGPGAWSVGNAFTIDYEVDALTQTLRREVASQLRQPQLWRAVIQEALATPSTWRLRARDPALLAMASPTPGAAAPSAAPAAPSTLELVEPAEVNLVSSFYPSALRVSSAKGLVFDHPSTDQGIPTTGGIPAEGLGTRFMWYPGKGAVRAGTVNATQWDDGNIGYYSTAFGFSTTARGSGAIALGYYATASGDYATALGQVAQASAGSATAIGPGTIASGNSATAFGASTTASGNNATALGRGTLAPSGYETALGTYNTDYIPATTVGWNDNDRLFVLGYGQSDTQRADALVILKNGNVGLGTSIPSAQLQLSKDSATKPGTNTWTIASDARLKDILGPYEGGLDEISALRPVRFHYSPANARGHDPAPEYVGFIAQEVQPFFPEAVSVGADGYLDFNMHAVTVAMVNALQTLREQNLALHQRLLTQEERLQALEERLLAQ